MPLEKQPIAIDFSQGLDQKSDSKQIPIGKFARLVNKVFNKFKQLTKRNGFPKLVDLPNDSFTTLTTFNNNLTAIGSSVSALSESSATWVNRGAFTPIALSTQPLIRTNTNQSQVDSAVSSNGLMCTVFTDVAPSGTTYKYAISEFSTGQSVVSPTSLATAAGSPRVWVLGNYFVIVFKSSTANNLQYVAIPVNNPTSPSAATTVTTNYLDAGTQFAFEGTVANSRLYLSFNGNDGGGAIRTLYLSSTLVISATTTIAGKSATMLSVCADETQTTPVIWVTWYTTTGPNGYTAAFNQSLTAILASTNFIAAGTVLNLTTTAQSSVLTIFYELSTVYSYGTGANTNLINTKTVTQAGVVSSASTIRRSVGLASKAFLLDSTAYVLSVFSSDYQPTYFLLKSDGSVLAKLAYSNGGGYLTKGLPNPTIVDSNVSIAYLIKDLLEPINRSQGATSSTGVYAQTGINLATFDFTDIPLSTAEVAKNLHLSGGFLSMYDGYNLVEHGFHLWPDYITATWSAVGGSIKAQPDGATNTNAYYYQVTYEWTDNQGNIFRSAPSIPLAVTTTGALSTGSIVLKVPTLRVTSKTSNPVKIVIYRWSISQQTYFQVTSTATPTLNDTTADNISFTDTLADSSIVGNSILYTTGGVIENIGAPATNVVSLYKSRLFLIDAEDENLLWYSKPIVEGVPAEMSDLLTLFVSPTIGAQGNTGPLKALAPMDDKLILFKKNAIYYEVGNGPDSTGANNDFQDPIFITSTVGCANQRSIVFIPQGLLFQSDKGIWLLGRDLSTQYIGAPVEDFNSETVLSAITVPGTNEVRFTMSGGKTLMYDYFFNQWGVFEGIPSISSTLYEEKHTFLNQYGEVSQEAEGTYLDGSRPTLIGLTTGWINAAGLQGYERAYFFYLLGTYYSPHKLLIRVGYDYQPPTQSLIITPDNYAGTYGDETIYGGGSYGGPGNLEQWRIFFEKQKCQAFQIWIDEVYDASYGVTAGAGLTLSGLNLVVGVKSGYPRLSAARSAG